MPDPLTLRHTRILMALAEAPSHGYAVGQAVARAAGDEPMLPGSLYRALAQLLRRGLIEETPGGLDDPRRREYAITDIGRRLLVEELGRLSGLAAEARRLGLLPR